MLMPNDRPIDQLTALNTTPPRYVNIVAVAHACSTEKCIFMGKELRASQACGWTCQEVGLTQFLAHKSTLLSTITHSNLTNVTPNPDNFKQLHIGCALNIRDPDCVSGKKYVPKLGQFGRVPKGRGRQI